MIVSLLQALTHPLLVIVAAIVAAVGLFGLFGLLDKRRDQARLRNASPVLPAATPETGYALVTGTAAQRKDAYVTSLLTEHEGVGYRFRVEQQSSDEGWWEVIDGGETTDFDIAGNDERIAVVTGGIPPMIDDEWEIVEVAPDEPVPESVKARLEASPIDTAALHLTAPSHEPRRYMEAVINPGDPVYAFGVVRGGEYVERRIEVDSQQEYTVGTRDPDDVELDVLGEGSTVRTYLLVFGLMVLIGGMITVIGISGWIGVLLPSMDVL